MVVVSTRDFRTNQTKYLNLAKAGEYVVLNRVLAVSASSQMTEVIPLTHRAT